MEQEPRELPPTEARPPVLDYRPAQPVGQRLFAPSVGRVLVVSLLSHLAVFVLYAATLDGGFTARRCAVTSIAYWLVAALVLYRRRFRPTLLDLGYLGFGYPAMLAVTEYFAG